MKKTAKTYKLKVKIGKRMNGKVFRFVSDNPVEDLLSINLEKLVEPVAVTLETNGLKATRHIQALKARMIFKDKLHAFHLIKNMHFILKETK